MYHTKLEELISFARENDCSDLHLSAKDTPKFRKIGNLMEYPGICNPEESEAIIVSMLNEKQINQLNKGIDADFTYVTSEGKRQRVNVYKEQGKLTAAIRIISDEILSLDQLGMPDVLKSLSKDPRGLVLLTGPTGSGKSTTLAAIIDYINEHRHCHILTIEDPIEYVYMQKKALIHQRQIHDDVEDFDVALRSAMREDPDVILVGEMRDYETIAAVVTLAETGHLVFSTLHTIGAAKTIDRIIDVFPPHRQEQIRIQLAGVLNAVITQQLLPKANGQGRIAALEIMCASDAVRNLIRENKAHQLNSMIQMGQANGMQSLNLVLARMVQDGSITKEVALKCSDDPEDLKHSLF